MCVCSGVSSSKLEMKRLTNILLILIISTLTCINDKSHNSGAALDCLLVSVRACVFVHIHNDDLIYDLTLEEMQGPWDNKTFNAFINYTQLTPCSRGNSGPFLGVSSSSSPSSHERVFRALFC